MKYLVTLFIQFLVCSTSIAQQEELLPLVEKLIGERQYETAFKTLQAADPEHQNPQFVLQKTELVLNYFVSSMMHQRFGMKDLDADETIETIRENEENDSLYSFAPDSALLPLIEQYPNNYLLQKMLGNYYHEVLLRFSGRWLLTDQQLLKNFVKLYKKAYQHDVYDYWSLYGIGYGYLMNMNYQDAIVYFKKSIELKENYATAHYNLAYAYYYENRRSEAIESAHKALKLYQKKTLKADAARMIAIIHAELKDNRQARTFLHLANRIDPKNNHTLKALLPYEITKEQDEWTGLAEQYLALNPNDPTIYQDLIKLFRAKDCEEALKVFLINQLPNYQDTRIVQANIFFYLGTICYSEKNMDEAKSYFKKAEHLFHQVFDNNNQVFDVIESYIGLL